MEPQNHYLDILKHFIFNNTEHHVTIIWKEGCPLFKASDVGNILGITKIRTSLANFDDDEKVALRADSLGGPQQTLFLTEPGVYRLLFNSRKPIAKPFQKWVARLITDIQHGLFIEIESLKEKLKNEKRDRDKHVHDVILNTYKDKCIVYFGLIKNIDNKMLIKIGATKDVIRTFTKRHPNDYGEIWLLKAVECIGNNHFEQFILQHPFVKKVLYREPVKNDGGKSIETVLVTEKELKKIYRIVDKYLPKFKGAGATPSVVNNWYCISSGNIQQTCPSKLNITRDTLYNFIHEQKFPLTVIGSICGVTSQAIRKRCKKLNIPIPRKKKMIIQPTNVVNNGNFSREELHKCIHEDKMSFVQIGLKFGTTASFIREICKKKDITKKIKQKKKRHRVVGTGKCQNCNVEISKRAQMCQTCDVASRPKKFNITREELYDLVHVQKIPYTIIGKQFGVSDNAIRKRCKSLNIEVRRIKKST